MHQAGVANTKWAIEYWKPAADAFKLNNPDAEVYNGNCNVLLHRAMLKAGALEQCDASESCAKESSELDEGTVATLPLPGQVDFICGGPPCQVRQRCLLPKPCSQSKTPVATRFVNYSQLMNSGAVLWILPCHFFLLPVAITFMAICFTGLQRHEPIQQR